METTSKRINKYDEIFDIKYFHEHFSGLYSPKVFNESGRKKIKVPLNIYKQIISQYFDIYMKELYFYNNSSYFLFGGILMKCQTQPTVKRIKKNNSLLYNKKRTSIVLYWRFRPSKLFFYCVKLVKLTGGNNNKMAVIEKLFRQTNDIELLPKFEQVKAENNANKTIYTQ